MFFIFLSVSILALTKQAHVNTFFVWNKVPILLSVVYVNLLIKPKAFRLSFRQWYPIENKMEQFGDNIYKMNLSEFVYSSKSNLNRY